MGVYTQENRMIQLATTLGVDVLLLQGFTGQEGISRLFQFDLRMHSENRSISLDSLLGKKATIRMVLPDKSERYFNGIISSFSQGGSSTVFAYYHATMVPWLWLLTRTSNCRIFQNMTVPDIIQKIFKEQQFSDYTLRLHGKFDKREYCVQYRETDFNFVSRLMEEEGIFYFFEHELEKHILVLADHYNEFKPCKNQPSIRYELSGGERRGEEVVTEWGIGQEVRPGRYAINDFNFEQPLLDLTSSVAGKDERKYEIYDYPGEFISKDRGEQLVGIRMQEEESPQIIISGSSTSRGFYSGSRFKLGSHYRPDLNKEYVLTSIYHSADQGSNYRSSEVDAVDSYDYRNHFQCVPYPTPYRPLRLTPVPVVHGSQTAIVVGPSGEEIYVDKYGRVKVQFHWDREGKYNEDSSCWIRVSQNWAGNQWGTIFIPRIGQEVIVDFLEGDPDRPIITGRVYNGSSMPPYALPDEKTKSTIKSLSSKGGGGFNEIRFEDKKGEEQIFIHGQKNEDIRIENDLMEWIGRNTHLAVGGSQFESIGGDKHLHVYGDHNEETEGTISRIAHANITEKADSGFYLVAGANMGIKAGVILVVKSPVLCLKTDGGCSITLEPGGVHIDGPMVFINSVPMPMTIAGPNPDTPKGPKEADKGVPGQVSELPPPKKARPVGIYSPGALAFKSAAKDGVPFCAPSS